MATIKTVLCLLAITCVYTQYQSQVSCPVFYVDYDQQGSSFRLCSTGDVPNQYNDQVSSFVVPAGYQVILYRDYNLQGQSFGPYTQGSYNVPSEFNDQLSSVAISRVQNRNCPTFYVNFNQEGASFQLCSTGNVPSQYNDQASSFVVPAGYQVTLYRDYNLQGQSFGPYTQGSYNVPGNFNDQLSSVAISRVQNRNCPTFYVDYNRQGASFQMCSSGNVPSRFNDQISSFTVPSGYSVRLHSNNNRRGRSIGNYGPGSYNVPSNFNDLTSSVTIVRRR